ncbi:hypothetical protein N9917_02765 [Deltaproteobacteria bacterium]|nr:hypothetical protein [Deltaproteobacteria bacterium]
MKAYLYLLAAILVAVFAVGCGEVNYEPIVVNSLEDLAEPPEEVITLRSALASAASGQAIIFDESLDGGIIELSIVGNPHTMLKGEVMGMREEPSGPVSYLVGYFDRDYGRSALYARKTVVIDASSLPSGITVAWTGGEANPARVLAVRGNLTLVNVSITGGWSVAEELPPPDPNDENGQLSTRARGAGIAVWGIAKLENCTLYDNHARRDATVPARSRDAGVFGGGIYADIVDMDDCVVSGNSLSASGVSGGGVFSVGGAEAPRQVSKIRRSAITGNGIHGIFTYGGGVYSDGGGIGKAKTLDLENTTVARNLVAPLPGMPPFMYEIGYWRGGGVYMSNGSLELHGCTIVENEVHGTPRTDDLGKPNLAGGVVATIGNAHAVENMVIGHSVITGNTVHETGGAEYEQDIFTGSLFYFKSRGFNRIGVLDFSQILVPVGQRDWRSLCRRHFPKQGDEDGALVADVLNLDSGVMHSDSILSAGVDAPDPVVLHYEPQGSALDQVPVSAYIVNEVLVEYLIPDGRENDFLAIMLGRLEDHYRLDGFAAELTAEFEAFLGSVDLDDEEPGLQPYLDPSGDPILTLADTQWFGPSRTWPSYLPNYPYMHFWHHLDTALLGESIPGMGPEVLGDDAWSALFDSGPLVENPTIAMSVWGQPAQGFSMLDVDQRGAERPANPLGDIGAIEIP